MADYLNIAGRVRTTASDGVAMEAQEVKDLNLNKSQQEVNADVQTELGDRYTKEETYSKEQLDNLITTPDVNYVSVVATDATTAVTDILPATGEANTIYRVGNWNGTQYDPTMYALYAWNGSAYVCLAVRSFVGEVYDISVNHPDGQGNPTPYTDLAAALGTSGANIPADIRRGGMSIKFIQGNAQTSDNNYVQYFLTKDEWSIDPNDWQKMNLEEEVSQLQQKLNEQLEIGSMVSGKYVVWYGSSTPLNGTEVEDSGSCCTGFIPVKPGFTILLKNLNLRDNRAICTYDTNQNFLEGILRNDTTITEYQFVIPQNAAYIRASGNNGVAIIAEYVVAYYEEIKLLNEKIDDETVTLDNKIDRLYDKQELNVGTITDYKYVVWYGAPTPFNGTEVDASDSCCTDFIPVTTGYKIKMSGVYLKDNRSICAYDSNHNFLEGIIRNSNVTTYQFTVPEGCAYIRATGLLGKEITGYYIHPIDTELDKLDEKINTEIQETQQQIENKVNNLYDTSVDIGTLIDGKYVIWYGAPTPFNGTEVDASDSCCTDFIPVTTGYKIKMSGVYLKDNRSICAYDKNKAFVEGVARNSTTITTVEYTIPDGVAYIRISGKSGESIFAELIDDVVKKAIAQTNERIDSIIGNAAEKKWLFLGDSITHESFKTDHPEYGWVTHFQEYVKAAKVVNVSVDGAHWKDYADTVYDGNPIYSNLSGNVIGNQVEKIIRGKDSTNPNYSHVPDYDEFDFIVIAAGTNDDSVSAADIAGLDSQFAQNLALEDVNRQLFPGIMRYAYQKLIGLYPNAKIFYCTPIQACYDRRGLNSILDKGDIIKQTCARLSDVTAIDTEKCGICGLYEEDEVMGRDTYDGLHTNENGGIKIAKYNAKHIIVELGIDSY